MTYFGKTYSDTKPQEVEILESMVYVAKNIEPITRQIDETHTLNGFQYDYYGYTKDEYIKKMDEANHELQSELLDTQSALCDVYEILEGIING